MLNEALQIKGTRQRSVAEQRKQPPPEAATDGGASGNSGGDTNASHEMVARIERLKRDLANPDNLSQWLAKRYVNTVTVYDLRCADRTVAINRFRTACESFIFYLQRNHRVEPVELLYIIRWIQFIARILISNRVNALTLDDYWTIGTLDPLNFVKQPLQLNSIESILKLQSRKPETPITLSVWGRDYWQFLHACSILVQNDPTSMRSFAALLINFDMLIPCAQCAAHYVLHDPIRNVSVPMIETGDAIGTIYQLHNRVNATAEKRTLYAVTTKDGGAARPTTDLSIKAFCEEYNCILKDSPRLQNINTILFDE